MRVRKAKPGDVPSIARVHVTAWQACYSGIMPKVFLDRISPVERAEGWRTFLEKSERTLLVCQLEGETVGFAACGPSRDQDKDATQVGEVYAIYVTPEFWEKGCGHALWLRVVKELIAAKFEELNVWVLEANQRARRFYEREGCALNGNVIKDAYIGGVKLPEVRYWKQLPR